MISSQKLFTPPSLRWCQESNHVLVIVEQTGMAVRLTGLDAAVWKWLTLSYPYETVLRFAEAFLKLPDAETRTRLNQTLHDWVELGLLVEEGAR
jgi:hypothetical protein